MTMRTVLLSAALACLIAAPAAAKVPPGEMVKPYTPTFIDWIDLTMQRRCDRASSLWGSAMFRFADDADVATFKIDILYEDTEAGRKWRDNTRAGIRQAIQLNVKQWTRAGYAISEDDFMFSEQGYQSRR